MWKRLVAIVCLLFALFLAVDKTVLYSNLSNNVLRIDIVGENESHDIEISPSVTDMSFKAPSWCKDCLYGRGEFENKSKDVTVKFKVRKKDTVSIWLRGEHLKEENIRIPLFVDYENFVVNNKRVLGRIGTTVWHDAPYKHKMNLKAGDTVEFTVRASKTSIFKTLPYLHFDFLMFVIYFLCTYFVALFIKKYIDSKGFNKIDFCFLAIFGIILFIPMLHISNAEKSDRENRTLANKPSLMINNKINNKYGAQFDAWFNDRFNGRDTFVDMHTYIKYSLSNNLILSKNQKKRYVNKSKKWITDINLWFKDFDLNQLDLMSRNINKLKTFCYKRNMGCYIIIAPSKNSLYGSDILPNYPKDSERKRNRQAIDYIKKHNGIDIIYPYEDLLEFSKNNMAFFKTDHHWTDGAAFIAYQKLMQQIKKDFPNIRVMKDSDFDYFYSNKVRVVQSDGLHDGSEYKFLGLNDKTFFDTEYKYFDHKAKDKLNVNITTYPDKNYIVRHYNFNGGNKYNLTLFGDSFGENMEAILPYNFRKTLRLYTWVPSNDLRQRNLNIERFEKDISNHKTDILVVIFSKVDNLMYLYKE